MVDNAYLCQEVEAANQSTNVFKQRLDNYQEAIQWVVKLAFSPTAVAIVTAIASTVLIK